MRAQSTYFYILPQEYGIALITFDASNTFHFEKNKKN